jgi:predicted NBD/HSP70 family sugar kinase
MNIEPTIPIRPTLDPPFIPAALWNKAFRERVRADASSRDIALALTRPDGTSFTFNTSILSDSPDNELLNLRYMERQLKFLLWQRGASDIWISGCDALASRLQMIYSATGARHFDAAYFGDRVYGKPLEIHACASQDIPKAKENNTSLGRHLDGCRIGFDLGGSDRKCAALIDGKVVFSEETEWNPYFESDPEYHIQGIQASLERAAAHLPRVDAIGGSAAGIYVNSEVRAASLFRGVSPEDFDARIRHVFRDLQKRWNNVPFDVANDGEVTALAGSMSLGKNAVLGVSLGTSQAAGYVTPEGRITTWINELAFAPVDYRADAPMDEWSGDAGCGVQYFSQQAVARLAPAAGIALPDDMPFPEKLESVQALMKRGDASAARIYDTIGAYLGYSLAHYANFYMIENVLLLGRVTSGDGGTLIIDSAEKVLATVFPELGETVSISMPDEALKRHGQAVAAASLPEIMETA